MKAFLGSAIFELELFGAGVWEWAVEIRESRTIQRVRKAEGIEEVLDEVERICKRANRLRGSELVSI
jgi:L-fucose isomerase-like protein